MRPGLSLMRIVAGTAKGRKLRALRGQSTRPTAERVREALFDILGLRVEGARVLDLFAGTGALGLEALSRGAAEVLFIEKDPVAFRLLGENLVHCGFGARGRLLRADVRGALRSLARKGERFDLVFLDPPYRTGLLGRSLGLLGAGELLKRGAWVVAEHWGREDTPHSAGRLRRFRLSRQGEAALSFYEIAARRASVGGPGTGDAPEFVENK
ncbi:MAG: 16S rRNA (guanine(966)-N(2))-methyltransferase RsmD [Nitrospinota bacterium]